jgi:hypothetical protein
MGSPLTGEVDSEGFSLVSLNPRGRLSTATQRGTLREHAVSTPKTPEQLPVGIANRTGRTGIQRPCCIEKKGLTLTKHLQKLTRSLKPRPCRSPEAPTLVQIYEQVAVQHLGSTDIGRRRGRRREAISLIFFL